jgi:hypothetical protein
MSTATIQIDRQDAGPHHDDLLDTIIAEQPVSRELAALASSMNELHLAAVRLADEAVQRAIRCGEFAIQVKREVGHNKWQAWLAANCPAISKRTSQRYMKLARGKHHLPKNDTLSLLTMAMAMKLICRAERKAKESQRCSEREASSEPIDEYLAALPDPPAECTCGDKQEPKFLDDEWWCEACGARIDEPKAKPITATVEPVKDIGAGLCPHGGQHVRVEDDDGAYCEQCKEPMDAAAVQVDPVQVVKLSDKELRLLKSNVRKLAPEISAIISRVGRIEEAIGAPDDELIELGIILRKAERIALEKSRGWASIKNKRQMGRGHE